jgi:hypothetical protein
MTLPQEPPNRYNSFHYAGMKLDENGKPDHSGTGVRWFWGSVSSAGCAWLTSIFHEHQTAGCLSQRTMGSSWSLAEFIRNWPTWPDAKYNLISLDSERRMGTPEQNLFPLVTSHPGQTHAWSSRSAI